jgi:hypothetical protein
VELVAAVSNASEALTSQVESLRSATQCRRTDVLLTVFGEKVEEANELQPSLKSTVLH